MTLLIILIASFICGLGAGLIYVYKSFKAEEQLTDYDTHEVEE